MPLPSFLCIGAQKAATTWLYVRLMEHPDVWMPAIKELHYFDYRFEPRKHRWAHHHIRRGARGAILRNLLDVRRFSPGLIRHLYRLARVDVFSEDWYRRAFDRPEAAGKVIGDITPTYCALPPEGVEYVRSLLGQPRLIYIIRDPLERALSHLRMKAQRRYGRKATQLDDAQWQQVAKRARVSHRGNYRDYIRNWLQVFDREALLFIPFGQVRDEPRTVLRQVEQHLGIAPFDAYRDPHRRTHATQRIEVPASVREPLAERLQPQRDFLESFFEPEFIARL